jgi:hypothetical protein
METQTQLLENPVTTQVKAQRVTVTVHLLSVVMARLTLLQVRTAMAQVKL